MKISTSTFNQSASSHLSAKSAFDKLNNTDLQEHLLKGVSRTFALTIPQLPMKLRHPVSNAYLLCRTIDTIEDEPTLTAVQKRRFCQQFVQVVGGQESAASFAEDLSPLLSSHTTSYEQELIHHIHQIIDITYALDVPQRKALARCVRIMAEGMAYFQDKNSGHGLENLAEMNRYCYYVAGVVGEMLTELFCHYSPEIGKNHDKMMHLAVSFGQGLQMTNILKDIWEDQERGACWLPRDIFEQEGFDLDNLGQTDKNFERGLVRLIGLAHAHLYNAFQYTLMIPSYETGIRKFCLWALGMAVLTLQKINRNRNFTRSEQVKISRNSVKATVVASNLAVRNDFLLKLFFNASRAGLPFTKIVD